MAGRETRDVTGLLADLSAGDAGALDRLLPVVYDELRRIADSQMARERPDHTLSSTALIHEAYVRLASQAPEGLADRSHFFGVAARAMRQVLVDHARRKGAAKRGGDAVRVTLGESLGREDLDLTELLSLDEALDRLDALDPRLRVVVEQRFFGGMSEQEIAESLGVTTRTVQRDWVKARAWLYRELYGERDAGG